MTPELRQVVEYRLQQARETLEAGKELLANKHYRDAINRAYYAMFYAALGLLAVRQLGTSKHSAVLSLFSQHLVKTGLFPAADAANFREAFELRQKYDYREFVNPNTSQAERLLQQAEAFLAQAEMTWQEDIRREGPPAAP